jgi:hypothetical protein
MRCSNTVERLHWGSWWCACRWFCQERETLAYSIDCCHCRNRRASYSVTIAPLSGSFMICGFRVYVKLVLFMFFFHEVGVFSFSGLSAYSNLAPLHVSILDRVLPYTRGRDFPCLRAVSRPGLEQPEVRPETIQPVATGAAGFLQDVQPDKVVNEFVGRDLGNMGLPDGWAKFLPVR